MLQHVANWGGRNVIKKETEKIRPYKELKTETANVECKNKSDTSNNEPLKIIRNVPEQRSGEVHQGTSDSCHIGHCTLAVGSATVKVKGE
jgi:hypothetical protein